MHEGRPVIPAIASVFGAAVGWYLGLYLVLPGVVAGITAAVLKRIDWKQPRDRVVAATVIAQVVWIMVGALVMDAWLVVALDMVVLVPLCVAWLDRPRTLLAVGILVYEVVAGAANAWVTFSDLPQHEFKPKLAALTIQALIVGSCVAWLWTRAAAGDADEKAADGLLSGADGLAGTGAEEPDA